MADDVQWESGTDVVRRNSKRCMSIETDNNRNEVLDPRIYAELEKLNKTSDCINFLEREADQLRAVIHQANVESTRQLNALAEKLGSCVEKAKPYYDARIKLREIQIKAQSVTQRFETACGDLSLAKEMVHVAEDCYAALGRPDDSAWQEMLNHSTAKVNEAELERKKTELEHERMTQNCAEVQREVATLQKEQKRSITKSRPYFEMKAKVNLEMEEKKKKLNELESSLADAKADYSSTLQALERISDEIHEKRQANQQAKKRISRHEKLNDLINDSNKNSGEAKTIASGAEKESSEVKKNERAELCLSASAMKGGAYISSEQNHADTVESSLGTAQGNSVMKSGSAVNFLPIAQQDPSNAIQSTKMLSENPKLTPLFMPNESEVEPKSSLIAAVSSSGASVKTSDGSCTFSEVPTICLMVQPPESSCAQENRYSPETVFDPSNTNADVMQSIMQLKSASISPPIGFLNPGWSHLSDENSDKDSVTSSCVNANVLGDEQIESLMLEKTTDFKKILERMNSAELGQFKGLELPAKLSYLQEYVNFDPIWIEDDFDNIEKKGESFV